MKLDSTQQQAVDADSGAVCIVAPPGSGKTHTLVARIAQLIERGTNADRILALTFTTKAAKEMEERLSRRGFAAPYCATFHALAHDIVRTHGSFIGIPADFTLVEDEQQKTAGALTFDELLSRALVLLKQHDAARTYWQNRFDHILVDEYQDTDDEQDNIVALLAEPHGNLCVIGDPHQAIYGFRGANVANFLTFDERYPDARRIALATNYRSTPTIVAAAHALIGAETPTAFRRDSTGTITLASFGTPSEEARWIVKHIEKLVGGMYHESGAHDAAYQPGDIAVLYRFNAIGKELERAFAEAGIPYALVTEANLDEIHFDTFRVPLMTMHAAKGLEFPIVFVAGLEDGVMPYLKNDCDLDEERRLFFVAMTRAKDLLFLSHTKKRQLFGKTFTEPSRFLRDLPREHLSLEERKPSKPYQKKLF